MKRNVYLALGTVVLLSLATVGCNKKTVEQGSVKLDPVEKTVFYGDTYSIKPEFSAVGEAKNKTYSWTSSKPEVAVVKPTMTGGNGEVEAKRIGEAIISYKSSDGVFNVQSKVKVQPRTTILNGFFYEKDADETKIINNLPRGFKKNAEKSNSKILFIESSDEQIPELIYELENGKLTNLNIILENSKENINEIDNYIKERFDNTGKNKNGILFFKNTAMDAFPIKTVIGRFVNLDINGETYELGVRVMSESQL